MPIVEVDGTDLAYHLIAFDADGVERQDDPGGTMSDVIADAIRDEAVTDVFMFSHGWRGDLPAADRQYQRWIKAMAGAQADRRAIRDKRPDFKALLVGIHWPSEPFGEEDFGDVSFTPGEDAPTVEEEVDKWVERLDVDDVGRQALRTILTAAADDPVPTTLPDDVRDAYLVLNDALELGSEGVGAAPDADREPFDPEQAYQAAFDAGVAFDLGSFIGNVLTPLKQLSFWTMKGRARTVGESGGHALLRHLMGLSGQDHVRFHLMGHSFGCIVVTSMVAGAAEGDGPPRDVSSVALVQGAVSLWSYCEDIPKRPGTPGYFRLFTARPDVAGPIIATTSVHDRAVGFWYPKAAGVARDVAFAPGELPTYGALGTFGMQGPGIDIEDRDIAGADHDYAFEPRRIYNLNGDDAITGGDFFSGAHSNIAHRRVAHAVWQAVLAAP